MNYTYLDPLIKKLEATRDPVKAAGAKKYLKNQFEFLGSVTGHRREILKEFLKEYGMPEHNALEKVCRQLWDLPEREYQHSAIEILQKNLNKLEEEDIKWIENLILQKSWWDTVDGLAAWICGAYFRKFPGQIRQVTERWVDSGNVWLQRTALLFQLKYKSGTDTVLLGEYIARLSGHSGFFIRKAIGWILREYSKTDKEWVRDFLSGTTLSGLSRREASRYL